MGRPFKWRILGVLTGPTADAIVEGDQRGLGAIEEIFELPGTEAEVRSHSGFRHCGMDSDPSWARGQAAATHTGAADQAAFGT